MAQDKAQKAVPTSTRRHYSLSAVSRSLRHFLVGKTFAMVCAFAVLFLLAGILEPGEYAVYVSLQALVILIGRVSGLGVQKAMLRYLPELRATENSLGAYRLLWQGTLLRFILIGLVMLGAALFLPALGRTFGLDAWLWLIPWYLLVGYLRLMNHWIASMLESFLWQREAQYSIALGGLVKLVGVLLFASQLDLTIVVIIEFTSEAIVLLLLGYSWATRWRKDPARLTGTRTWWQENRGRALRFGFWGFLQNQSGLLYGSAPNRLVAAHFLPSAEVALFGLADNLINQVRRFMPTQLFISIIRPVALARFSTTQDFSKVSWIANLAYRLNLSLLVLGIALMVTVGEPLFAWLTDGKYPSAAWLVAGLLILMATEGMRTMVELMAQAVERNQMLFLSNLIQSASLLLAIPLVQWIGLWGLVVANIVGTVLANLVMIVHLRHGGYAFNMNLGRVAMIITYGILSTLLGWWLATAGVHFLLTGTAITALYAILCLWKPPLESDERELILKLVKQRIPATKTAEG
ncbi:MAG: lipopolysaccharide biosynthesis protein [Chromatiales bacterium]|nr:lipopolysaccharide biosynthesis protein [Chromatiales bacterium]